MITALGNETATSIQCLLFIKELRTIKFGNRVLKYTIVISSVPLCEGVSISELPDIFTLECDKEEENATEEKLQPSTSRYPEFSLVVTCPQSHKIMQNEMPDPIKDLQLTNNTAKPFLQVYNCVIFCMTYESKSISLTAK
jgi:hypothetical protein